jgi:uncharacterized protein with HEPN domain
VRDPRERLRDILEAIRHIERYSVQGRNRFESDELLQTWFVHHLRVIGEAARSLPVDVRDHVSDVPWSKIVGMRHILVHCYFEVDTDVVWDVVEKDLPGLRRAIERALQDLEGT